MKLKVNVLELSFGWGGVLSGAALIFFAYIGFQDIVRLTQRLITLGKENWELAVYPLQSHSFTDPDAWTDEYRRIFKLFQQVLNQ